MDDSGGAEGVRANRSLETAEEEHRLSDLPDPLIHHILSFLPSTKEAIRTGILSKRWKNQWTFVSNLIFHFYCLPSRRSLESISRSTPTVSRIIDRILVLHECSKIQKFHIISDRHYEFSRDPGEIVRFVVRKQVEELILKISIKEKFRLPDFFFRQSSLVKLELSDCAIMSLGMVCWGNLKDLFLDDDCYFDDQAVQSIVSGSPKLENLEISYYCQSNPLVISSESLKSLIFMEVNSYADILCPNLVEFEARAFTLPSLGWCDKVWEKFLSGSPLLESLIVLSYKFPNIRISSKSLKKLSFNGVKSRKIVISCPHLEELEMSGLDIKKIRLMNLPSSVSVFLDSDTHLNDSKLSKANVAKQILEQLQHVSDLELGSSFVGVLSERKIAGLSVPLVNGKYLALEGTSFEQVLGIVCALCSSSVLETLVLMLQPDKSQKMADLSDIDHREDNYWNSNETRFSSLVSNLRTVKLTGFSEREEKPKLVLDFVEFVLKNAVSLEKISVILGHCGTDFEIEVSQKLFAFPKCCNAVVELSHSK